jgi:hypothetical protein
MEVGSVIHIVFVVAVHWTSGGTAALSAKVLILFLLLPGRRGRLGGLGECLGVCIVIQRHCDQTGSIIDKIMLRWVITALAVG